MLLCIEVYNKLCFRNTLNSSSFPQTLTHSAVYHDQELFNYYRVLRFS